MNTESLKANPLLRQWLGLGPAGQIQAFSGKVDLGQGISHALRLIVAEELRLPATQIDMVPASTRLSPDEGVTSGSLSVQHSGAALRCAAAHLREACRLQMAQRCGVGIDAVHCDNGLFTVPDPASSATYSELADRTLWDSVINTAHAVTGNDLQSLDSSPSVKYAVRPDMVAKVFGEFEFIQDRVMTGMCHGMVFRPGTLTATVIESDMLTLQNNLQKRAGVLKVVRDGLLLGVLTESESALTRIAQMVEEDAAKGKLWCCRAEVPNPDDLPGWLKSQALETTVVVNTLQAIEGADKPTETEMQRVSAAYHRPFLQHASIGLCCALAVWREDQRLEVWSHSQGIFNLRRDLALAFEIAPEQVQVAHVEGAGCYGHNGADDVAFDAAWLAQHTAGRPVRVQWTRLAELAHAPLAPAMLVHIEAGISPEGQLLEWTQSVWSQGHGTRPGRGKTPALLGAWQTANALPVTMAVNAAMAVGGGSERNAQPPYDIACVKVLNHRVLNMPFRVSAMRALGAPANVFAAESFMDELAHRYGKDPLAFRLDHLSGTADVRAAEVLQKLAVMAGWTSTRPGNKPEGWGRGLAYARYKNMGAYCAVAVELVVAEKIRLKRLWVADLGHVVDPQGAVNQLEGGALQSASWALCESAQLSPQGIASSDWTSYPILKFSDMPLVEVSLMTGQGRPSLGAGECSSGPTGAAIANAIFDAMGVRMRHMPFTPENMLKILHADSTPPHH
ncbi:hypothetical protein B9Z45_05835 [Limnohabitans sp. 2KL-17]|uniref:xanthine dehydrogenase family protein molybdopterin-binding subunit n=1 Tax=Limnohabitans sp. 2KL-17 TaxID=1100704 RepID=UPI000D38B1B8|nr:molybdopterin cofactor-binding domain-containing protein [Limnohabitans sp. 2KL-17]PUE61442.1 hypothetical protein B9Z45_05835 [Limnohabitans sp. 2KL-17]